MFALPFLDIGNERWTTSGFLTRLSNGGPPQVPGTHAGTRGAGEFDGIIAAVKEDEIYYHRDQCDMITMINQVHNKDPQPPPNVDGSRIPKLTSYRSTTQLVQQCSRTTAPYENACLSAGAKFMYIRSKREYTRKLACLKV